MVLNEAAQGVDTVCEILKTVARRVHIIGIYFIIDTAGQVIEGTDVTLLNAVFLF